MIRSPNAFCREIKSRNEFVRNRHGNRVWQAKSPVTPVSIYCASESAEEGWDAFDEDVPDTWFNSLSATLLQYRDGYWFVCECENQDQFNLELQSLCSIEVTASSSFASHWHLADPVLSGSR